MAQKSLDNRIKITHFVNPHLFYFRWLREEGFNAELDKLEKKVEATVKERAAESTNSVSYPTKIRVADVVGVFVPDWHKYIRASVKKKEQDDFYSVWCIDYGFPMVLHASNVFKLPGAFTGMQLKTKRIHLGGMENCLPADKIFDINADGSVKEMLSNWSPPAIDLMQKILDQAVKLEFEHVHELLPQKRPHFFGRLMMQRQSDGQMLNAVKILLDMDYTVLAESEFMKELLEIESLQQSVFASVKNELLTLSMGVAPVKMVSHVLNDGYTNSEIYGSESENESLIDEVDNTLTMEDNEFFDESASVLGPVARKAVVQTLEPVLENVTDDQTDQKMNESNGKVDNDVQNNHTSPQDNQQRSKNSRKNFDRKQQYKDRVNVPNQKNQSQKQQHSKQQQRQDRRPPQQQQQQQSQNRQQNHHQKQQPQHQHGPPRSFDQPAASQQNPHIFNFHEPYPLNAFPHPHAPNHQYRSSRPFFHRNSSGAKAGCPEFKPSNGQFYPQMPSPFASPFGPPTFGGGPPSQFQFNGIYGSPSAPGLSPPSRHSNGSNQFNENSTKQIQNMLPSMHIQSPNHANGANQRAQNRLRNRNSDVQERFNRSPSNAAKKINTNGKVQQRDADGDSKATPQNNSTSSKSSSVKLEKPETIT